MMEQLQRAMEDTGPLEGRKVQDAVDENLLTTLNAKYVHSKSGSAVFYETGRRAGLSADQLRMQ